MKPFEVFYCCAVWLTWFLAGTIVVLTVTSGLKPNFEPEPYLRDLVKVNFIACEDSPGEYRLELEVQDGDGSHVSLIPAELCQVAIRVRKEGDGVWRQVNGPKVTFARIRGRRPSYVPGH